MPDNHEGQMIALAARMDMLAQGFDDMVTAGAGVYLAGLKIQELPESERMAHILDSMMLLARTAGCEIERGLNKELVDA
ncbi:MAG: hypothetical protein HC871_16550 [Rhizobiales bacterium]|nr:hypothetical protein [Hyphomicrobiales bacterium]